MDVRSKQILLSVIGIMVLVIITVGITYALFTYTKEGTTENVVQTGTLTFEYIEKNDNSTGISLTSAIPELDEVAKLSTTEGRIFDFKIVGSSVGSESINYNITAQTIDGSTLDPSIIKLYLTEINSDQTETEIKLERYNNLLDISIPSATGKILYSGTIKANTKSFEKNYRLRMWISSDTDILSGNYNNKTFGIKVNVYANAASL